LQEYSLPLFKIDEEEPEDLDTWDSQINKADLEFPIITSPAKLPLTQPVSETQSQIEFDFT
jgi:hypothetical protein